MNKKYVVIDLEMCRVPYDKRSDYDGLKSEIIEIGAVIVDENLEITDTFKSYVSPEIGLLDNEIKNLTGINESNIENAPKFKTVFRNFIEWVPEGAIIVSWSETDKHQIMEELKTKNIEIDNIENIDNLLENWQDCQQEFTERMKSLRIYKLSEALVIADINYDENIHDALVDAKNTAMLFIKMKKEKVLKLSKHYNTESENKTHSYNPFVDLLNNLDKDNKEKNTKNKKKK